jgi:hypothetical protein
MHEYMSWLVLVVEWYGGSLNRNHEWVFHHGKTGARVDYDIVGVQKVGPRATPHLPSLTGNNPCHRLYKCSRLFVRRSPDRSLGRKHGEWDRELPKPNEPNEGTSPASGPARASCLKLDAWPDEKSSPDIYSTSNDNITGALLHPSDQNKDDREPEQ